MTGVHGRPARILLLGGTSEIGGAILNALGLTRDDEVVLAGRDPAHLGRVGKELPCTSTVVYYDAADPDAHQDFVARVFGEWKLDLAISAAGLLVDQHVLDKEPARAAELIGTNFTGQVSTLLAVAHHMRDQGHGTIVVLSSIAAVRPRKANFVYGAAKAGLDAFARGLADSLDGTGAGVVLVRPGFVVGRMTAGMRPAPLATTPAEVGAAVAAALGSARRTVWVPRRLSPLAVIMRLVPRSIWRRLSR